MDPENPTRRTEAGEPVTIDLEAARTDEPADGVENAVPEDVAAAETPDEPVAESVETVEEREEPVTGAREPEPARAEAAVPQKGGAGAFAAGILGGLIALIGAGSLQYGGYLPSLGPRGADDTGAVANLSNEVAALKTRLSEASTPPAVDLQPLEARLAALESAAPAEAGADPQLVGKLEGEVTRLSTELAALREAARLATEAVSTTESRLSERIAAAEQKIEEPRSDIAMARAVAASALKTAIDRGGPYLAELEALASVAPDEPALAGLREHAATGVSSRADLVRDFPAAADAILDAVHQPEGDQGIVNRLMASAASAIRVRPVGSVEGDTPEAVVARIENKLQNGDFKGAEIEWRTLPEAGQAAGADYKRALDRRVAVEDLVGGVVSGALSGDRAGNQAGNQG